MSALTEFLLARIAEDEAVARAGVYPQHGGEWYVIRPGVIGVRGLGSIAESTMFCHADHIARHDPARVLAECEAKRAIVDDYLGSEGIAFAEAFPGQVYGHGRYLAGIERALRALSSVYRDHAEWREEWG